MRFPLGVLDPYRSWTLILRFRFLARALAAAEDDDPSPEPRAGVEGIPIPSPSARSRVIAIASNNCGDGLIPPPPPPVLAAEFESNEGRYGDVDVDRVDSPLSLPPLPLPPRVYESNEGRCAINGEGATEGLAESNLGLPARETEADIEVAVEGRLLPPPIVAVFVP